MKRIWILFLFPALLFAQGQMGVGFKRGRVKYSDLLLTGNATINGTLTVTGATTLSSTLALTGAATLSDEVTVSDTLRYTKAVGDVAHKGSIDPSADESHDLGRPGLRWSGIYGNIFYVGDSTTGDQDGIIYFADDGDETAESVTWNDGSGQFELSDNLKINGPGSGAGFVMDGNQTTGNLAEFINDDDGSVGDSSVVITKLGYVGIGLTPLAGFHVGIDAIDDTPDVAGISMRGGGAWATMELAGTGGAFIDLNNAADGNDYDVRLILSGDDMFNILGADIGFGTASPQGNQQWSEEDTHGGLIIKTYGANATITADATITAQVNVPTGALIVGAQLHVKTALVGGETWDADFTNVPTAGIASNQAVAQNTNVSYFYDVNGASAISTGEADVEITKNAGGAFTAQGLIEVIIYAYVFDTWANE